ncbi:methylated-DNA--[protein]-cysteine S-methyltransferase [Dysosmobacter sp.]|uniref:methylated-DNA--[protein]-cysteine S-methyltransferase n=1 Tax=Dysosmobacter sp. TaxID=2591382 RepID=UPI002A8D636E|nr:methylated-DNA--[protein]-cysteine S-methyltransferase [Dysosmobacter sp.]MDY3281708.1 methylated-DNA--[protein]-cysteine S-methyltransferase [Dysosmobacter sp.]
MRYYTTVESPVGTLTVISDGEAVTGLDFPLRRGRPRPAPEGTRAPELPVLRQTERWLAAYFAGEDPGPVPPVRTEGTAFQERVWAKLRAIPCGEVTTYGRIADAIAAETGRRQSAQAVGGAVGRNPVAILIPCHRVVGSGGSLTGFGGGLDAKVRLLETEGVDMARLFRPKSGTAL